MKYVTLFGELLIFIPILILLFFVDPNKVWNNFYMTQLVNFFHYIFFFFTKQQIYIWLLISISMIIQEFIWWLIKYFFFKERPAPMAYYNWYQKVLAGSFPSLHSARAYLLFLFSLYFTNIYVAIWFFIYWALIAYSRVYLKKHYCIDLLWWIILSAMVFYIVVFKIF